MKKTTYVFLFCFALGLIFNACHRYPKCDETFYRLKEARFVSFLGKNGAKMSELSANDSLAASDTLGINIGFYADYYAQNAPKWNFDFSFFPTANAKIAPCIQGQKGANEQVTKITLTSSEDFDAQHLKNQSLNDLFWVRNSIDGNFTIPFEDYLAQIYAESKNVPLYNSNFMQNMSVLLKAKPISGTKKVFTVSVELSNGTKLSANSTEILFL